LPYGYSTKINPLLCRLNAGLCKGESISTYKPEQKILLPDVKREKSVGRRTYTLPLSKRLYTEGREKIVDLQKNAKTVGALAEALDPGDADERLSLISKFNYSYRPAKDKKEILSETKGTFVLPVTAFRVRIAMPALDISSPPQPFSDLVAQRAVSFSTPSGRGLSPQAVVPTAPPEQTTPETLKAEAGSPLDDRCMPSEVSSIFLNTVHYCLPRATNVVTVAVIDRAIDAGHPAFRVSELKSRACNYRGGDDNTSVEDKCVAQFNKPERDPDSNFDINLDHGTHVAGIIAAAPAKDAHMVGLDPTANIVATTPDKIEDLFRDKAFADTHIYNLSLGESEATAYKDHELEDLKETVRDGHSTLFVIAAGNTGAEVTKDALAALGTRNNAIVVGASTADKEPGRWISSAKSARYVNIAAPGDSVRSTLYGGGYGVASGTSMATAFVAGTAAIIQSEQPYWEPYMIKERLLSTADLWTEGHGNSTDLTSGELNVQRAVLDMDSAILKLGGESECKGVIDPKWARKLMKIDQGSSLNVLPIPYRDLLRMKRHKDGQSFTILYIDRRHSDDDDSKDGSNRVLVRLEVPVKDITWEKVNFTSKESRCSKPIEWYDVDDFINVIPTKM
jgi:hypothetical protein